MGSTDPTHEKITISMLYRLAISVIESDVTSQTDKQ